MHGVHGIPFVDFLDADWGCALLQVSWVKNVCLITTSHLDTLECIGIKTSEDKNLRGNKKEKKWEEIVKCFRGKQAVTLGYDYDPLWVGQLAHTLKLNGTGMLRLAWHQFVLRYNTAYAVYALAVFCNRLWNRDRIREFRELEFIPRGDSLPCSDFLSDSAMVFTAYSAIKCRFSTFVRIDKLYFTHFIHYFNFVIEINTTKDVVTYVLMWRSNIRNLIRSFC